MESTPLERLVLGYQTQHGSETFDQIAAAIMPKLKAWCRHFQVRHGDRDDVMQLALLALSEACTRYDPQRAGPGGCAGYLGLVVRARLTSASHIGHKDTATEKRFIRLDHPAAERDPDQYHPAAPDHMAQDCDGIDYQERLQQARPLLSVLEWRCLQLFLQGLTYIEIGQRMNINPKRADNALCRCRWKLQNGQGPIVRNVRHRRSDGTLPRSCQKRTAKPTPAEHAALKIGVLGKTPTQVALQLGITRQQAVGRIKSALWKLGSEVRLEYQQAQSRARAARHADPALTPAQQIAWVSRAKGFSYPRIASHLQCSPERARCHARTAACKLQRSGLKEFQGFLVSAAGSPAGKVNDTNGETEQMAQSKPTN